MTEKKQRVHLKAPDHWVNDPNGFIYYQGYYHLFYQYFPYGPRWGTMHWGHAVSRDLVNWEHKGIALFPSKRGDQNGCFSGSAVEREGKLCLIYTGVRYEEVNPEDIHVSLNEQFESCQMMAVSEDGFSFDNWKDKEMVLAPVADPKIGSRTHTRDPKVWKGGDGWYMILGSTLEEKQGEALIYRSEDLGSWFLVNQASKGPEYGWMWECPDYVKVPGGEALFVSAMGLPGISGKEKNQALCFPVTFDEASCRMEIPDEYQFLDYGMDLYAPQTTLDRDGRRILTAWVRMPEPVGDGWIGMFCAPRVVEMENGHIFFRLHPQIREALSREILNPSQAAPEGYRAVFELEEGQRINIGGMMVWRNGNRLFADRSGVYPHFEGAHLLSATPQLNGGCHVEALVDENLVELFVNDGEYTVSSVVYRLGKWIRPEGNLAGIKLYTLAD